MPMCDWSSDVCSSDLSVPGSGGRHKVLLLRSGAEWEPLSLTCMREEEGESLLRPEWDGGDHSLLEPEHLPCPSPSLQHIHQPSPDHHPFSLAWATVFQLDSAPLFLQSSTHAAQVDFLKWRSDHSVQGICRKSHRCKKLMATREERGRVTNWEIRIDMYILLYQLTPVLLLGKSHGWRSLVGCSPWGREESDTTERLHFRFSLSCIGEGNGNPLQCSCLENPRDGGAWWAAVYGVAQSRTQLKRLSSSSRSNHLFIPNTLPQDGNLVGEDS